MYTFDQFSFHCINYMKISLVICRLNKITSPEYVLSVKYLQHAADSITVVAPLQLKVDKILFLALPVSLALSWLLGDRTFGEVGSGILLKARPSIFTAANIQSTWSTKDPAHIDRVLRRILPLNLDIAHPLLYGCDYL